MFATIQSFEKNWQISSDATTRLMAALTDSALGQQVAEGHRTLAQIAWHTIVSIPEMAERTGLKLAGPKEGGPRPETAKEMAEAYREVAESLLAEVKRNWTDATLLEEDDMYGERWVRGVTLLVLLVHEVHHRGQMTVLMRQAGLTIPGMVGPAKEEWEKHGMKAPEE